MKCEKCGNKILPEWRFCYSCGAVKNNEAEILTIDDDKKDSNLPLYISNLVLLILNLLLIIVSYIFTNNELSILLLNIKNNYNINLNTNIFMTIIFIFMILFIIIYRFYSMIYQLILKKASCKWYLMLIPFVNIIYFIMSMFKLAYGNYGNFILFFMTFVIMSLIIKPFNIKSFYISLVVSIIYLIIYIILNYKIAKNFNVSKLLTILFALIMYPIIALNKKYEYFCDN